MMLYRMTPSGISIHGPRVGADLILTAAFACVFISIHGPRVGADAHGGAVVALCVISIHGPRVGADSSGNYAQIGSSGFQSTAPVWGPTPAGTATETRQIFQSTAPVWGPTNDAATIS